MKYKGTLTVPQPQFSDTKRKATTEVKDPSIRNTRAQ